MTPGDLFPRRAVEPGAHPTAGVTIARLPDRTYVHAEGTKVAYRAAIEAMLIKALKDEHLVDEQDVQHGDILVYNQNIVIIRGQLLDALRLRPERFIECIRRAFGDRFEMKVGYLRDAGQKTGEVDSGEWVIFFVHSSSKQAAAGSGAQAESRHPSSTGGGA